MIKRSKLKQRIYDALSIYSNDEELRSTLTNVVFSNLDYADMEFAPEETSAVEKWNAQMKDGKLYTAHRREDMLECGNAMRDELQARIVDLEKRIEEKDAEIERLKQPILESCFLDDSLAQEIQNLKEQIKICIRIIKQYVPDMDEITLLHSLGHGDYAEYVEQPIPESPELRGGK
jgi:hypothetical protein